MADETEANMDVDVAADADADENAEFEDTDADAGFEDTDNADGWDDDDAETKDDGGWDDTDFNDNYTPLVNNPPPVTRQVSAPSAMTSEEIQDAINKKIKTLSEELDLEPNKCLLLLRRYKWNTTKIIDVYFTDMDKILVGAGVCITPKQLKIPKKGTMIECEVCLDDVEANTLYALECGHRNTCNDCWVDYMQNAAKSKECVHLTCPTHKCYVTIPQDVWALMLKEKDSTNFNRYSRFCRENFIENSKEFAFCPGKSCDKIYSSSSTYSKEVECIQCKFRFCWACKHESHFPASCHNGEQWLIKCSSEAENIQWILAKTKRCPKCHVHIEKNQGCNHMTCRKTAGGCGHEFCWLCKGDWTKHGSATGGYYQCNIFEKNKTEGKLSDEQNNQLNAQNELERYEFHYTRFDSHSKSSKHSIAQKETTHEKMHELAQKFQWRLNEAQFLLDAVNEAIKCWHVLAWTYPIAYYLDDKKVNLDLFKTQQAKLENFCDGLQEKLDFDLEKLGDNKTRQEIIGYTRTAQKYRRNLVEYIEAEISF